MTGDPGPAPSMETLCELYARYTMEKTKEGQKQKKLEIPTVWLEKRSVIYKGELCPMTRKWFWTSVARCSCPADMCPAAGNMDI